MAVSRARNPRSRLAALLDALERELLAADADDVRGALADTGRAASIAGQQVRALLNEAVAASEDGPPVTPPQEQYAGTGLPRH